MQDEEDGNNYGGQEENESEIESLLPSSKPQQLAVPLKGSVAPPKGG